MLDLAIFVKALTFGGRNADKVVCGSEGRHDEGRMFATGGQVAQAAKSAARLDNALGKGTQAALNLMCNASKHSKVLDYAVKGADWASKNVNPLLVGAAAYRVMASDDKEKALKKEVLGMSSMFGTEFLMREFLHSKYMDSVHKNMKNKYAKAALAVIEGLGFVAGSIAGSTAGYKVGEVLVGKEEKKKAKADFLEFKNEVDKEINRLNKEIDKDLKFDEALNAGDLGSSLLQKNVLA